MHTHKLLISPSLKKIHEGHWNSFFSQSLKQLPHRGLCISIFFSYSKTKVLLTIISLFFDCYREKVPLTRVGDSHCGPRENTQKTAFWALFSPFSIPHPPLKGLDGATNDCRRGPKGPVGLLSTTAGLLDALGDPRGLRALGWAPRAPAAAQMSKPRRA